MFISPAYAQAAGASGGGEAFQAFLPLILIFVVFYFLLIRPQQKKMKQHREMLAAVRRGDKVITGGGIIGTVTKVENDEELTLRSSGGQELTVEIAKDIKVKVQRGTISAVLNRTEPVSGSAANDTGKKSGGLFGGLFGGGSKKPAPAPAPEAVEDNSKADNQESKDGTKS